MTENPSHHSYRIEKQSKEWMGNQTKTITFVVTENCQLSCKYCYFVQKNNKNRMSFEIGRKAMDFFLDRRETYPQEAVVFDFIGGEPFLEIDLIDQICDYFKKKSFSMDHDWFNAYRFSFTTNGLLYNDRKVQHFITKNRTHLDMTITLDGTRQKHNLQRIFPDGKGSYDAVVKNIPLWLKQFPDASTKVTIGSEDIPFLKESILHLWELGIKNINANVVFENVWKENDDRLFEEQLMQLADAIIEKEYFRDHRCSLFNRSIGKKVTNFGNWCGVGKVSCVDYAGNLYPCVRFTQFSLQNKKAIIIGHCDEGIDSNKLRPFLALNLRTQSTDECLHCEVGSGCAWCQGANYDFADTDTVYQRATYICLMHKARVRANQYFWKRLDEVKRNQ